MGIGAINLNKMFSSFDLEVKGDEEHKIMKVKVQKISVIINRGFFKVFDFMAN